MKLEVARESTILPKLCEQLWRETGRHRIVFHPKVGFLIGATGHVMLVPVPRVTGRQAAEALAVRLAEGHSTAESLPKLVRDQVLQFGGGAIATTDLAPSLRFAHIATGGCFDRLHDGHRSFLQSAMSISDKLTVLLNTDRSVRGLKGRGRPLQQLDTRILSVRSVLREQDEVLTFTAANGAAVLSSLRPSLFVKGTDYWLHQIPEAARATPPLRVLLLDSIIEMHTTDILQQEIKNTSESDRLLIPYTQAIELMPPTARSEASAITRA